MLLEHERTTALVQGKHFGKMRIDHFEKKVSGGSCLPNGNKDKEV